MNTNREVEEYVRSVCSGLGRGTSIHRIVELGAFLHQHAPLLVMLSDGIDSATLAAFSARVVPHATRAVTVLTGLAGKDFERNVTATVKSIGIPHEYLEVDLLSDVEFTQNPRDRCYLCGRLIARAVLDYAKACGIGVVVDGLTISEVDEDRRGFLAMRELGLRTSPFVEVGFSKEDVIMLAKSLSIPNFRRPITACLASRVQYDQHLTRELLDRIDDVEAAIRRIAKLPPDSTIRLRIHGDIARVEVDPRVRRFFFSEHVLDKLERTARHAGFHFIAFDCGGYYRGKMDTNQ